MSAVVCGRFNSAHGIDGVVERVPASGEELGQRPLVFLEYRRQLSAGFFAWCGYVEEPDGQTGRSSETDDSDNEYETSNHVTTSIPASVASSIGLIGCHL